MIAIAPMILAFALIIAMGRRFGVREGYLFALAGMLWLPYIMPYPLQAIGRLVKAEDIGLTEVMIMILCIGVLPKAKGRVTTLGNGRWLTLFVIGGVIALSVGALYHPLEGFTIEAGASFFRQACLMSFALYVGVRRLIGDNATAEQSIMFLLIGSLVLAALMIFGARPVTGINYGADLIGQYSLPFGIIFSVGGNSGSIYFFMVCLLASSLYLNGSSRYKRIFGLLCWSVTFYVSMKLSARAVWIVALPLFVMTGLLSVVYCKVPWRRMATMLALPLIALALLYFHDVDSGEYIATQIDTLRYADSSLRYDQSVEYRVDQYYILGPIVAENPWGTGYLDVFPLEIRQPHSLILKLALTTGFLGLAGYFVFILLTLRRCVVSMKKVDLKYRWILVGGVTVITFLIVLSPGYDLLGRFNFHATFIFVCAVVSTILDRQLTMRGDADRNFFYKKSECRGVNASPKVE